MRKERAKRSASKKSKLDGNVAASENNTVQVDSSSSSLSPTIFYENWGSELVSSMVFENGLEV